MNIAFDLILIFMLLYLLMIAWFILGNLIPIIKSIPQIPPPVSIIIAIRNGENTLPDLIQDLKKQNYSGEIEFILVDDQSDDSTSKLILDIVNEDERFKHVSSLNGNESLNYKKRALDAGIKVACNEWLLFTDADCRVKNSWISGMSSYFTNNNDFVIGYSEIDPGTKLVTKFQSLDYLMLMISARGTTRIKNAWASTGQNQAYRKSLFNKVGGFSTISQELQGDDSLFLQICLKQKSTQVAFADDDKCRVISNQENSWIALFKQRIRWSSDAKIMWQYNNIFFLSILVTFFLALMMLIFFTHGIFYNINSLMIFFKLLFIYFLSEFILYYIGTKQLSKTIDLLNFSLWFLIHIPYVVLMGFGSFFSNHILWKGR